MPSLRTLSLAPIALVVAVLVLPGAALAAPASSAAGTPVLHSPLVSTAHGLVRPSVAPLAGPHVTTSSFTNRIGLSHPARGGHPVATSATPDLSGAIASLSTGAGPARGHAATCAETSALAASCSLKSPSMSHPAAGGPEWQNATPGSFFFGPYGPNFLGAMTWDASDGYLVFYGGCDVYACPDNQTWVYDGYGFWDDIYNATAVPPAETGGSLVYDYSLGAVILFGGEEATGLVENYTWVFLGGTWANASGFLTVAPPARYDASFVYDGALGTTSSVLFGGCEAFACATIGNDTWNLTAAGWNHVLTFQAPPATWFGQMVYAAPVADILQFGGCINAYCTLQENYTWYYGYNGYYGSGEWYNDTPFLYTYLSAEPPALGAGGWTFDDQLGVPVMVGGYNGTLGYVNETWIFTCPSGPCIWFNETGSSGNLPGIAEFAFAQETPFYQPLTMGGYTPAGMTFSTWVFEPTFTTAPMATPSPGPARAANWLNDSASGGGGFYYSDWTITGAPYAEVYAYGSNTTFTVAGPGAFLVNCTSFDYYGVEVLHSFTWTATGITASASAAPTSGELGVAVTFTAPAPSGGTGPYTFAWSFGDATTGTGDPATHTYSALGTYAVNLTVTDVNGLTDNLTMSYSVVVGPSVTFTASKTTVDANQPVTFTPTASGGVTPYSYAWKFGDGLTSVVTSPQHTFTTTGTLTVNLTVTDGAGGVAYHTLTVTVNPQLSATVTTNVSSALAGGPVGFTSTPTGGTTPYTVTWLFGDGHTATGVTTTHAYASAGSYSPEVWINDSAGSSVLVHVNAITVTSPGGKSSNGSSNPLSGSLLWILLALVVVIIIVAVAVMMMRRGKGGGGAGPASAPPSGATGGAPPGAAGGSPPATPPSGSS